MGNPAEDLLANFRAIAAEEARKAVAEALGKQVANTNRRKSHVGTKELAGALGKTVRTVHNLIKLKGLPFERNGHDLRFVVADVEAWAHRNGYALKWSK